MAIQPSVFEEWKKNIERILTENKFQGESKRCPKCKELALTFDIKQGKIYCTKCGFTQYLTQ